VSVTSEGSFIIREYATQQGWEYDFLRSHPLWDVESTYRKRSRVLNSQFKVKDVQVVLKDGLYMYQISSSNLDGKEKNILVPVDTKLAFNQSYVGWAIQLLSEKNQKQIKSYLHKVIPHMLSHHLFMPEKLSELHSYWDYSSKKFSEERDLLGRSQELVTLEDAAKMKSPSLGVTSFKDLIHYYSFNFYQTPTAEKMNSTLDSIESFLAETVELESSPKKYDHLMRLHGNIHDLINYAQLRFNELADKVTSQNLLTREAVEARNSLDFFQLTTDIYNEIRELEVFLERYYSFNLVFIEELKIIFEYMNLHPVSDNRAQKSDRIKRLYQKHAKLVQKSTDVKAVDQVDILARKQIIALQEYELRSIERFIEDVRAFSRINIAIAVDSSQDRKNRLEQMQQKLRACNKLTE
jgi:hypothetical protein